MISEKITLHEVFSLVDDDDDITRGVVTELNVNRRERSFSITVKFDKQISNERISGYKRKVVEYYKLNSLDFSGQFPTQSIDAVIKNELDKIFEQDALIAAVMTDCKIDCAENTVTVTLCHGNSHLLRSALVDKRIKDAVKMASLGDVTVKFAEDEAFVPREKTIEFKSAAPKQEAYVPTETAGDENIIYGKEIVGDVVPISDIDEYGGTFILRGKPFGIDSRQITRKADGKKLNILSFNITDYTQSISCKMFVKSNEIEGLTKAIGDAKAILVSGKIEYDSYQKELVMSPKSIMKSSLPAPHDDAAEKRVELHAHTKSSAMDAVIEPGDLVKRAVEFGHRAVAITDHGVVQAFPEAQKMKKKLKSDIKLIFGCEGYLLDDKYEYNDKNSRTNHIIILAKNYTGLFNLYKLITLSHMKYFYKRPRIPRRVLSELREGLLLGSACEQGELYRAILNKESEEKIREIASFYDYLEVQPLGNNEFMLRSGIVESKNDLIDINKKIIALGKELGKPVVATCDVHFLNRRDEIFRRILMAGQDYQDADQQPPIFFRTTDEMLAEFDYLDEETAKEIVIKNPNMIADMIDEIQPVPDGQCPPEIEGSEEVIESTARENARRLYGDNLPQIVEDRLSRELKSVIGNGYAVMYNIARLLVEKSTSDGYLVGSRGSVGSSFLAFLSNITEVNSLPAHYRCPKCFYTEFITDGSYSHGCDLPEKNCPECGTPLDRDGHDIPFETFLGFEGDKQPDIDLNFSGEYQATAHKYVGELFGEENVFKAGTVSTVADKTAYGYVKRYYEDRGIPIRNAEVDRLTLGCTNVTKTTGQHPGGIIILPKGHDIHEFTPVQYPANKTDCGIITTHFDYHSIDQNLLKLDILGHDVPTMLKMLKDLTGLDPTSIPLNDPDVMSLFKSTGALGVTPEDIDSEVGTYAVPEFGTRFTRKMLLATHPTTFAELVRISGLSHGTNVWTDNAETLIEKGVCTLKEAICTRDDIMLYLIQKGLPPKDSFTIMERIRKGRKLTPENEALMRKSGVPEWYIESCNKIQYMFPKAHAVAYVIMSLRIAYFKVHYPLEFYATFYTCRGVENFDYENMLRGKDVAFEKMKEFQAIENPDAKKKDALALWEIVNEMYARGIHFLPIDIYKSHPTRFEVVDGAIRPALVSLPGLGESAAEGIARAREDGEFLSIEDFKTRSGVSQTMADMFAALGCFGDIPTSNQLSLFDM